jgi:hypothetical protein
MRVTSNHGEFSATVIGAFHSSVQFDRIERADFPRKTRQNARARRLGRGRQCFLVRQSVSWPACV